MKFSDSFGDLDERTLHVGFRSVELVQNVVSGLESGEEHLQMNVGNNIECFQLISIYNTDFGVHSEIIVITEYCLMGVFYIEIIGCERHACIVISKLVL